MRKTIVYILIIVISLAIVGHAVGTEKLDVVIDPLDDDFETLFASRGDSIQISVSASDNVNVYIMSGDNYWDYPVDYSKAAYSREGVKDVSFSFTVPDDSSYYLVIYNPNPTQVTVDYEYSDPLREDIETAAAYGFMMCFGGVIFIIVIIVLVVYLVVKKDKRPTQPQTYTCPICRYHTRFIPGYNRWYCDRCQRYL